MCWWGGNNRRPAGWLELDDTGSTMAMMGWEDGEGHTTVKSQDIARTRVRRRGRKLVTTGSPDDIPDDIVMVLVGVGLRTRDLKIQANGDRERVCDALREAVARGLGTNPGKRHSTHTTPRSKRTMQRATEWGEGEVAGGGKEMVVVRWGSGTHWYYPVVCDIPHRQNARAHPPHVPCEVGWKAHTHTHTLLHACANLNLNFRSRKRGKGSGKVKSGGGSPPTTSCQRVLRHARKWAEFSLSFSLFPITFVWVKGRGRGRCWPREGERAVTRGLVSPILTWQS